MPYAIRLLGQLEGKVVRQMELSWIARSRVYGRTLLAVLGDWRLRERRRERGRRKLRRRVGNDPTMAIGSPSDALDIAEALLGCVPCHDVSEELWAGFAVSPLAALLFAASVRGDVCGVEWASQALVNFDGDSSVPGWRQAAEICRGATPAAATVLGDTLARVAELEWRQRNSVVYTMRAAIDSWLPVGQGTTS